MGCGFTVSCSVLQRVATCCSMLQVPNGSPVQKVGISWALAWQCVTVCYRVLQSVAVCCNMLQIPNGNPVQKVGVAGASALLQIAAAPESW